MNAQNTWHIEEMEVFFDGDCPICSREISFLLRHQRLQGIRFTDIGSLGNAAESRTGRSRAQLMERIHARLPDGTLIEGVEVFRHLYDRLGWKWVVVPTRWPVVRSIADVAYAIFARNRLRLTGRAGRPRRRSAS